MRGPLDLDLGDDVGVVVVDFVRSHLDEVLSFHYASRNRCV